MGAEDRRIELQLQGSRVLEADGLQFLWHWSIPHFYFHVVTAYDILRDTDVQLGSAIHESNHERFDPARFDLKEIHLPRGATRMMIETPGARWLARKLRMIREPFDLRLLSGTGDR